MTTRRARKQRRARRAKRSITVGDPPPECGGSTYVFGTGVEEIEGWPGGGDYTQTYEPGSILEITNGNRGRLRIRNVQGTAECPITIRNSNGGAVVFTSTTQQGLLLHNCRHVIIDGTGAAGVTYGFQCTAANNTKGMEVNRRSIHLTIKNVEIANCANIGLFLHTKLDTGYDYEETSPGTPSTFSGPNAWLDEDITISNVWSHDIGASAFYLANNSAKRDNVPDMTNLTIHDCTAEDAGNVGFNFKTQTNLLAYNLTANNNGLNLDISHMMNYRTGPGCSGVLRNSISTNATGNVNHGIFMNNAWRPMEVHDMTISDSDIRSITIWHLPVEAEDDGGTVNVHDNNLTSPAQQGIRFRVFNVLAAAGSRIVDNIIEHNAAFDCIQATGEPVGTESGNTCTPI